MSLTQIIGINILTIITFLCGYILGYIFSKEKAIENVNKNLRNTVIKLQGKGRVGTVRRPTQQEILDRKDPWHKKLKGGMDEMRKTLDKLVKKDE